MKLQQTRNLIGLIATCGVIAPITATSSTLTEASRLATERYVDVTKAQQEGYGLLLGCVSGNAGGAMGVHFANPSLVGDGTVDASRPEVLMYEAMPDGRMRLLGVEYVVIAADWNANHNAAPVLNGQLFHYNGSPNRYGLPPFYALHVWSWKPNPSGTFADWNPAVSCDHYSG